MCGIAGFLDSRRRASAEQAAVRTRAMTDAIAYRGPNDGDVWCDAEAGIALGHRRLSIIDLTQAGHQPMHSACGRYVISYNGEVYNAEELRPELVTLGARFRGHSDTEVMLEGFAHWGVAATVRRLAGMFAFALWDRQDRRLWLVRDRMGIKPLYWSCIDGQLLFGSELKALRAHPDARFEIDRDAVPAFLRFNYVPAPLSIYRGINKLQPGYLLSFAAGDAEPRVEPYWSLDAAVAAGHANSFHGTDDEAIAALEALLGKVVGQHLMSDVPLGAFLSGGIDSSAVVALMQAQSSTPVKTFTIGFGEADYNEARHAKAVAKHLGTEHHELYVSPDDALDIIPRLPDYYDEPFSDSSQIPTCVVSALTRKHVTVSLSGDGGDEVFGGYTRYLTARSFQRFAGSVPRPVRSWAASLLRAASTDTLDRLAFVLPAHVRPSHAGDRLHKLAEVLDETEDGFYRRLVSQWWRPEQVVPGAREPRGLIWDDTVRQHLPDLIDRLQYLDMLTYLPDDILTKVDRASMVVALEARVPLLDHRVVEFAWRLPQSLKIRGGQGKWILRQILYRHVPQKLIDRPKTGFGVPIGAWLRGPLRAWAEELLAPERLSRDDLLSPEPVRRMWAEHLGGKRNWQYPLWTVLMLQAWRERWH
jgi:asparagine synthase (glutamine-hydrolysing)